MAPQSRLETLGAIIELIRPYNCALAMLGTLAGALAGQAGLVRLGLLAPAAFLDATALGVFDQGILMAMLAVGLGVAGGNALNDAMDATLDAQAHPERPIPSGRLTPSTAAAVARFAFLGALVLGWLVNLAVGVVATASVALLLAYERGLGGGPLKARPLLGNVTVAVVSGALFLVGGLATFEGWLPPWSTTPAAQQGAWYALFPQLREALTIAALAAVAHLGREILKDVEDAPSDSGFRNTLATGHAGRWAGGAGALVLAVACALAIWPMLTFGWGFVFQGIMLLSGLGFAGAAGVGAWHAGRGQRMAKFAMVLGLSGFLVGAWVFTRAPGWL